MEFISETVIGHWVEWICGVATVALAGFYGRMMRKQRALEMGVQALLRDRLVQAYYHYSERGWVTLHGLESVNKMYQEYHNLGGNGTVSKLVEDINKLDVRDE